MYAFQVCGYSKSGKTTLIKELIGRLSKEGFQVASIKDIHHKGFQMDKEGTDTTLHNRAGADPVVARGLKETDYLYNHKMDFLEIMAKLSSDWLVVEGYNEFPLPKIVCGKTESDMDDFLDNRTFAIAGVYSKTRTTYRGFRVFNPLDPVDMNDLMTLIKAKVFRCLPYVDDSFCGLCGLTCSRMVEAIVQGEKAYSDCKTRNTSVHLKIGGEDIPLKGFVQNILRNTLTGMVSELRGWVRGRRIEIVLDEE